MAAELRLGKILWSLTQNIIAAAQLPDFALQFFQTLAFAGCLRPQGIINGFLLTYPDMQFLWSATDSGAMEQTAAHCEL